MSGDWWAPTDELQHGYKVALWAGTGPGATYVHTIPAPTAEEKQAAQQAMAAPPIQPRPMTAPRPSPFRRTPNQDSFPTPSR